MTQPTLKKILAIGAPLMDRIFKVPDSFIENSQSLTGKKGGSGMINFEEQKALTQQVGPELLLSSGGCAANAVKCMSKLGKTCALFGGIGQDDLGKDYKKLMNEYGVKTFFSTKKTPTGQVLCFVTTPHVFVICF